MGAPAKPRRHDRQLTALNDKTAFAVFVAVCMISDIGPLRGAAYCWWRQETSSMRMILCPNLTRSSRFQR